MPHALPRLQAERLGCLDLSSRNRLKARTKDFGLVRGGVQPNRDGGNPHGDISASEPSEESVEDWLGDERGTEQGGENYQDQRRQSSEQVHVERCRPRQYPDSRDARPSHQETQNDAQGQRQGDVEECAKETRDVEPSVDLPELG